MTGMLKVLVTISSEFPDIRGEVSEEVLESTWQASFRRTTDGTLGFMFMSVDASDDDGHCRGTSGLFEGAKC